MKKKILFYHKDCLDGFGSRWCFERKFGEEMEYIPVSYSSPIPDLESKEIWIADFSFDREVLLKMKSKNISVTLIDHHKTAESRLKDLDFCHFDMNHSGSVLCWKYLNKEEPIPVLLKYIEDMDLWKFKLSKSKEITSFLEDREYSFAHFESIHKKMETPDGLLFVAEQGSSFLAKKEMQIILLEKNKHYLEVLGEKICAVNTPVYRSELASKIGGDNSKYGLAYYYDGENYIFSIRPGKEKNFDVSSIAVQFGGGGHRAASGFMVKSLSDLNGKGTISK